MLVRPRALAANVTARSPIYRLLPPGTLRTYATLKYLGERSSAESIARLVDTMGGIPTTYHSTALVATRAAFRSGLDDQVTSTLDLLHGKFPESAEVLKLKAELHAYHDQYESALDIANQARLLDPAAAGIAAQTIKFSYHVLPHSEADTHAAAMVGRFPVSKAVLWAAAKNCVQPEQFDRIEAAWRHAAAERDDPADILRAVRQLATAAARADRVDRAIALFAQAITAMRHGAVPPEHTATKLAGRGAWSAITDICELLDTAGIPFFFAAGTALGFERVGGPLSDDGDIDVGIFDTDFDPERLTRLVAEHPRFIVDPHPLSQKVHMRHRGGCPVDFFRYYTADGHVWHDGVFVRWWNTPFEVERRDFNGLRVPLPANPDRYLTENYADWRIPNAEFDSFTAEAPNCTVHWPQYQQLHFMRRAFKAMSQRDYSSAAGELRLAGESSLASTIERAA